MKKLAWLCALALATGSIAAGCGGDDDDGGDGGDALTKEEFVAQANQICADGNKTLDAAGQALGDKPSAQQIQDFAENDLAPGVQDQLDKLGELNPPEADKAQVDAIFAAAQEGVDTIEADPASFVQSDSDPFGEANKLANAYGMTTCGSGGG